MFDKSHIQGEESKRYELSSYHEDASFSYQHQGPEVFNIFDVGHEISALKMKTKREKAK